MGFRNDKNIKGFLVREALLNVGNAGGVEPCRKGTCQVCDHIIATNTLATKSCGEVFKRSSHNSLYVQDCHRGIDDWEGTLFEKCEKHKHLK